MGDRTKDKHMCPAMHAQCTHYGPRSGPPGARFSLPAPPCAAPEDRGGPIHQRAALVGYASDVVLTLFLKNNPDIRVIFGGG